MSPPLSRPVGKQRTARQCPLQAHTLLLLPSLLLPPPPLLRPPLTCQPHPSSARHQTVCAALRTALWGSAHPCGALPLSWALALSLTPSSGESPWHLCRPQCPNPGSDSTVGEMPVFAAIQQLQCLLPQPRLQAFGYPPPQLTASPGLLQAQAQTQTRTRTQHHEMLAAGVGDDSNSGDRHLPPHPRLILSVASTLRCQREVTGL